MQHICTHTSAEGKFPSYYDLSVDKEGLYNLVVRSSSQLDIMPGVSALTKFDLSKLQELHTAIDIELCRMGVKQLDFGAAMRALLTGYKVRRAGWNGKDMWLSLTCPGTREVPAEGFWSPHNAEYARSIGGKAKVTQAITMKTATGEIMMGWTPNSLDLFAVDWEIVP